MKIIECPRDAMQGIQTFIPTSLKIEYINALLKVGFDTIDFGSFVSSSAIPQMKDTVEVLENLDLTSTQSKLLAIVASLNGALRAVEYPQISYLGFPLSVSETFQVRNTKKTIVDSFSLLEEIQNLCQKNNKTLVVYISMGFGNPYEEPYDTSIVIDFVKKLDVLGIKIISLSDTIGVANPTTIVPLFSSLIPAFPHIEIGAHFHSTPDTMIQKIESAYLSGCRRFDGAIKGYGGCPMAKDDLTGNIATENMIAFFNEKGIDVGVKISELADVMRMSDNVFPHH